MTTSAAPSSPKKRKSQLPKLIEKYYADLKDLAHQNVLYEMGTRPAFHALLAAAGKEHGWTLIAEHEKKVNGKSIRPDGTFKDGMNLVRGYWEAKDTDDDLDREIEKKRKAGYPLTNIIFEDNATAILYQNGLRIQTVPMTDPARLSDLITTFFRHVEPEIEQFELAVDEFKERVPDLAEGLKKKIDEAHKASKDFRKAFADFFELCKTSLNPNLSQSAVDEMLIQHILTERLIREIFDNPEFVRRNVIAAEVEKVMLAMTSHSFDRNTYLKELDRFYVAIERAARTMTDYSDKQHFLNTVYERFFQGYSVKLADTMGIVYTPQEIVDFMCASVAEVLEKEFGKHLWSDDVYIIDPCTGTGNFIVNLIRRIPKAKLEQVYRHRLFANEIMLLPYYIAALNIEHAYFEQTGTYEPFEGLCFVDTLDLAEHTQCQLGFMTAKNTERVERQRRSPITVVIGNPPYNAKQDDQNDNNQNRDYTVIDQRIAETYVAGSRATLRTQLYDAYVRFFRWATDRLGNRDGIICFVSNNSFVEGLAFDSFRSNLLREFTTIYHLDLGGNMRTRRNTAAVGNVFGIRVGVGITVAVRRTSNKNHALHYLAVDDGLSRESKLAWLANNRSIGEVAWNQLTPDPHSTWLQPPYEVLFQSFCAMGAKESKRAEKPTTVFRVFSCGVKSNSDPYLYDFSFDTIRSRAAGMCDEFNTQLDRWRRAGRPSELDGVLRINLPVLKWVRNTRRSLLRDNDVTFEAAKVRQSLYRPFACRYYYFERTFNEDIYQFPTIFPDTTSERENVVIIAGGYGRKAFAVLATHRIADVNFFGDPGQCFPFYVYDEDGHGRRENITDWALDQFRSHYHDKKIDKWAIFHYVYGILHHPGYREKFADNLKRELPRIPFAPANVLSERSESKGSQSKDPSGFWIFAKAGQSLAALHLDYEKLDPFPLQFIETPGEHLSYRVTDKMRLSKSKTELTINKSLTLAGIPPETYEYRLGNRSALEWVIDQYQLYTDPRSGITSDPNREDDPQYITRLVGQVIRVSLETMKIVTSLPAEYTGKDSG